MPPKKKTAAKGQKLTAEEKESKHLLKQIDFLEKEIHRLTLEVNHKDFNVSFGGLAEAVEEIELTAMPQKVIMARLESKLRSDSEQLSECCQRIKSENEAVSREISQIEKRLEFVRREEESNDGKKLPGLERRIRKTKKILKDFIDKHLEKPSPSKIRKINDEFNTKYSVEGNLSLMELIEAVVDKSYKTPHDPWYEMGNDVLPDQVELLLRHWLIVRHDSNPKLIKLETLF